MICTLYPAALPTQPEARRSKTRQRTVEHAQAAAGRELDEIVEHAARMVIAINEAQVEVLVP
tara:strand:+ start:302 stop:487 length:186 start_codon:yes stop_codon:yes gene_type:complete